MIVELGEALPPFLVLNVCVRVERGCQLLSSASSLSDSCELFRMSIRHTNHQPLAPNVIYFAPQGQGRSKVSLMQVLHLRGQQLGSTAQPVFLTPGM